MHQKKVIAVLCSELLAPGRTLLHSKDSFKWTNLHQIILDKLSQKFRKDIQLIYFIMNKRTLIVTDAHRFLIDFS